ncbi:MAG: efflux RND transporter periplasmic adaptor subunit [Rubrivivax sp.]|nr:MAG: efflux RND transporter periplasmic adaptor subunit [Rubrivivax sp.]
MNTTPSHHTGRISRGQRVAIVVIVLLGLAAAAGLLLWRETPSGAAEHADEHGDEHGAAHDHAEHGDDHDDHDDQRTAAAKPAAKPGDTHADAVALTAAQIQAAGIETAAAAPGTIQTKLQLPGEIGLNEDRTAHVVPRVAGVVEGVSADLGQQVRKGQLLAVISSPALSEQRSELRTATKRQALAQLMHDREKKLWQDRISPEMDYLQAQQALREAEIAVANATQKLRALGASPTSSNPDALGRYELRAPFDGVVLEKHLALGEAVKEDANVFTLSDLGTVWATLQVPAQRLAQVRVGERVTVRSTAFAEAAQGTVSYVGALIGGDTRTARARVALPNPQGAWRPGLFVNVELAVAQQEAAITVPTEAVHTHENQTVVFVQTTEGFEAQPIKAGRADAQRTEILQGLSAGARVATRNSFVVKAELGKASASHEH